MCDLAIKTECERPIARIPSLRARPRGGASQCLGWFSRRRLCVKGLFQRILLRLHVQSSEVNFRVEKQGQTPKKRAIIGQELHGVRNRRAHRLAKSRGDGHPPGCPGEGLRPHLPIPSVTAFWNPLGNPGVGEEPFPAGKATPSKI